VAWCAGDKSSLDQLMPIVYNQLRIVARRYTRSEKQGGTLRAPGKARRQRGARDAGGGVGSFEQEPEDVLDLHETLESLAQFDARKSEPVEMIFRWLDV
jgi:hypothetical protein